MIIRRTMCLVKENRGGVDIIKRIPWDLCHCDTQDGFFVSQMQINPSIEYKNGIGVMSDLLIDGIDTEEAFDFITDIKFFDSEAEFFGLFSTDEIPAFGEV